LESFSDQAIIDKFASAVLLINTKDEKLYKPHINAAIQDPVASHFIQKAFNVHQLAFFNEI
jgi:hypothetical protein